MYDIPSLISPDFLLSISAHGEVLKEWTQTPGEIALKTFLIIFFVFLNGFFVAAEFAIVKVRSSQLDAFIETGKKSALVSKHVVQHMDAYLSATQLGITLASLGLGAVGEKFLSKLIQPLFSSERSRSFPTRSLLLSRLVSDLR